MRDGGAAADSVVLLRGAHLHTRAVHMGELWMHMHMRMSTYTHMHVYMRMHGGGAHIEEGLGVGALEGDGVDRLEEGELVDAALRLERLHHVDARARALQPCTARTHTRWQ